MPSNRDLAEHIYDRWQLSSWLTILTLNPDITLLLFIVLRARTSCTWLDIAHFLFFVDGCMEGLDTVPQPHCPLSARKLRDLKKWITEATAKAWVRSGRIFEVGTLLASILAALQAESHCP